MIERIVATSEPVTPALHFVIESKGPMGGWTRLSGTYPDVSAAVAFAKAFAGPDWIVIEVNGD